MKKLISAIVMMLVSVILFTGVYASAPIWWNRPEYVPAGTYIIGTHAFDRNDSDVYDGTLTVKHIMLAAKTIEGDDIEDMNVYYKRARDGAWVDAISNEVVEAPFTGIDYYNGKYIEPDENGLWDVLGLPDVNFKQVVATEQVEHNKRKYVIEVAAINCDEYEVYYKSAGETEYTKMDNIPVVTDDNNLSVIEVEVPGNFLWMEHCDIVIRGLNSDSGIYSESSSMNATKIINPTIALGTGTDGTIRVGGALMNGTQLYVSNDQGKTYNPVEWTTINEFEDWWSEYNYEFNTGAYNSYWFKTAYTKITSTGTYTSYSRVVKYEDDIKEFKILNDQIISVEDGSEYREITAQITGDLGQYDNEDSWCCIQFKPSGANEYKSLESRIRLYNVQTVENDIKTVNITVKIPNKLYGENIDIYNPMIIKVQCENHDHKMSEKTSFAKIAEIGVCAPVPVVTIEDTHWDDIGVQVIVSQNADVCSKNIIEKSTDGINFEEVPVAELSTVSRTIYSFGPDVGNVYYFRTKSVMNDGTETEWSAISKFEKLSSEKVQQVEEFINKGDNNPFAIMSYSNPADLFNNKNTYATSSYLKYAIQLSGTSVRLTDEEYELVYGAEELMTTYGATIEDISEFLTSKTNYEYAEQTLKDNFKVNETINKYLTHVSDTIYCELDAVHVYVYNDKILAKLRDNRMITLTEQDGQLYFYACEELK